MTLGSDKLNLKEILKKVEDFMHEANLKIEKLDNQEIVDDIKSVLDAKLQVLNQELDRISQELNYKVDVLRFRYSSIEVLPFMRTLMRDLNVSADLPKLAKLLTNIPDSAS